MDYSSRCARPLADPPAHRSGRESAPHDKAKAPLLCALPRPFDMPRTPAGGRQRRPPRGRCSRNAPPLRLAAAKAVRQIRRSPQGGVPLPFDMPCGTDAGLLLRQAYGNASRPVPRRGASKHLRELRDPPHRSSPRRPAGSLFCKTVLQGSSSAPFVRPRRRAGQSIERSYHN